MQTTLYLKINNYNPDEYSILTDEDAKKILPKVGDKEGVCSQIRDMTGKRAFGENAYIFKKSFLEEVLSEENDSESPKEEPKTETVFTVPDPTDKAVNIPEPKSDNNKEEDDEDDDEADEKENVVIINEDNFFEDEVFNEKIALGRLQTLKDYGAEDLGSNKVVLHDGQEFNPMSAYKLNAAEWKSVVESQRDYYQDNLAEYCRNDQLGSECETQCIPCWRAQVNNEELEPTKNDNSSDEETLAETQKKPEIEQDKPKEEDKLVSKEEVEMLKKKLFNRVVLLKNVGLSGDENSEHMIFGDFKVETQKLARLSFDEFSSILNQAKDAVKNSKTKSNLDLKKEEEKKSEPKAESKKEVKEKLEKKNNSEKAKNDKNESSNVVKPQKEDKPEEKSLDEKRREKKDKVVTHITTRASEYEADLIAQAEKLAEMLKTISVNMYYVKQTKAIIADEKLSDAEKLEHIDNLLNY